MRRSAVLPLAALLLAAKEGQLKSVEKLLAAKAPLTWVTKVEKNSALHCAVINDDVPMVKLLIEKGASLTDRNIDGKTPFQLACDLGHFDCAELCFTEKDQYTLIKQWLTDCRRNIKP